MVVIRGWRWPKKDVLLAESRVRLYVDPRTGILRQNRHYVSYNARKKKERQEKHVHQLAMRRDIGEHEQLHCVNGIWYHVTLGTLPAARVQIRLVDGELTKKAVHDACWDAVRKEWVSRKHGNMSTDGRQPSNLEMYGDQDKYAVSKRQLNSQELKKHGLDA